MWQNAPSPSKGMQPTGPGTLHNCLDSCQACAIPVPGPCCLSDKARRHASRIVQQTPSNPQPMTASANRSFKASTFNKMPNLPKQQGANLSPAQEGPTFPLVACSCRQPDHQTTAQRDVSRQRDKHGTRLRAHPQTCGFSLLLQPPLTRAMPTVDPMLAFSPALQKACNPTTHRHARNQLTGDTTVKLSLQQSCTQCTRARTQRL